MTQSLRVLTALSFLAAFTGPLACAPPPADSNGDCDPLDESTCDSGAVCEETESGYACFAPFLIRGAVTSSADGAPIEGARVLALNDKGSAVTDVALTDADGNYELRVPVARDGEGKPVESEFTLQASAQGFQAFPEGARVALPISTADAESVDGAIQISSPLTEIALIPALQSGGQQVSGTLVGAAGQDLGGVLVVADGPEGAVSALTDSSGAFVLFNVPGGDFTITAYAAGLESDPAPVTVDAEDVGGVEVAVSASEATTVNGTLQLVNAPGGAQTSVILVVASTFNPTAARGVVPRGLRAPASGPVSITGAFSIEGVPKGEYYVLAAYENDDLVRDPDTNISGTDFVMITITGDDASYDIADSFKVTEALAVVSPGKDGPEAVTESPTLIFADDSSEDYYDVHVYDAFGTEVWDALQVPGVSGSDTVEVPYSGPLEPGMYYQFRASSWRAPQNGDAAPISTTEDLRGVFFLPAD